MGLSAFLISLELPSPGGRIPSWRKDEAWPGDPGGPSARTMQSIEFMPALVWGWKNRRVIWAGLRQRPGGQVG